MVDAAGDPPYRWDPLRILIGATKTSKDKKIPIKYLEGTLVIRAGDLKDPNIYTIDMATSGMVDPVPAKPPTNPRRAYTDSTGHHHPATKGDPGHPAIPQLFPIEFIAPQIFPNWNNQAVRASPLTKEDKLAIGTDYRKIPVLGNYAGWLYPPPTLYTAFDNGFPIISAADSIGGVSCVAGTNASPHVGQQFPKVLLKLSAKGAPTVEKESFFPVYPITDLNKEKGETIVWNIWTHDNTPPAFTYEFVVGFAVGPCIAGAIPDVGGNGGTVDSASLVGVGEGPPFITVAA